MTRKEFLTIYHILSSAYKWFDATDANKIKTWYEFFQDDDCEQLARATRLYIVEQPKEPSIAELRAYLVKVTHKPMPPVEQAWQEVLRAIGKGVCSPYNDDERQKRLENEISQPARDIARGIGFQTIGHSENLDVQMSIFFRTYEARTKAIIRELSRPLQLQTEEQKQLQQG